MRRTAWLVIPFSVAVIVFAAPAWQKKDFSQWTTEDARKIMTDSPWVKDVTIGSSSGNAEPNMGPSPAPSSPQMGGAPGRTPQPTTPNSQSSQTPNGTQGGGGSASQTARVLVEWVSATPIRLAELKLKAGSSQPPAADVETAKRPADAYVIAVIGVPVESPGSGNGNQLAQSATLNVKGKPPIRATSVKQETMNGGSQRAFLFSFPKSTPITLDDKTVEFRLDRGLLPEPIRATFKLKSMEYDGQLAL